MAAISGVAQIDGRVVGDVPVLPARHAGAGDACTWCRSTRTPRAPLDAVRVRSRPAADPERDDEVVLNEPFAEATHLGPATSVTAVLNGRLRQLRVVGVGISPEFLFQLPPGAVAPNDERFGVAWMLRAPLEAAFDLGGAFNDVIVRLAPGAVPRRRHRRAIDRRLTPYGGHGAYGRDRAAVGARSSTFASSRIRGMLVFLPTLFLLVAAFVLNVVLGRLVQGQREQVGALKAFGYGNGAWRATTCRWRRSPSSPAPSSASPAGSSSARAHPRCSCATSACRWPATPSIGRPSPARSAVVFAAAAVGALQAMRSVVALQPVEAMRPPTPPLYRRGALERLRVARRMPAAAAHGRAQPAPGAAARRRVGRRARLRHRRCA